MFKTTISNTLLTSDAAQVFFPNINGDKFQNDSTFLATLRALLAPRITEEDHINLRFTTTNLRYSDIGGKSMAKIMELIRNELPIEPETGMFVVHSIRGDEDGNKLCFKAIGDQFLAKNEGYVRLEKMTVFFEKSFPVACFINESSKNVVFFVESMDIRKMHYLQTAILPAMPWYFDPKVGVSEEEMNLVRALREKNADAYEAAIKVFASKYDFRSARVRQLLAGFETRFERIERDRIKTQITQKDRDITSYNDAIGDLLRQRNELCTKLLGLELKVEQGGEASEIMDYFLCNTRLTLESVNDNNMTFCASDYMSYFDKDMADRMIKNDNSYLYRGHDTLTKPKMRKFWTELFIKETIKIRFCAAYSFAMGGNVSPITEYNFPPELSECTPNPHIDRFHCMGNYSRTINTLLQENNYIGALEQCIASCKSLNLGDSAVMQEFVSRIYGGRYGKCVELPDGTYVDVKGAIKWIEEQEAADGKKEKEAKADE